MICELFIILFCLHLLSLIFILITNTVMQDQVNKKAHPGQKLSKYTGETLGYGLYIKDNSIYCSVLGSVQA